MFGLHPCRWLGAHFLVYTPTSMGVCMHLCKESSKRSWRTDRQRAVGIRVHAGSWAVQAMLSVSVESQRGKWERWRKRGGGEGGGGGLPEQTLWKKLHRRRKRTRNKLRGNGIKKGGCQSGLSWLPHPVLCAKFQKRPVPSLTCGGRLKWSTEACAVEGGFRQNKPSLISLWTHGHTKYCNINNISNTHIQTPTLSPLLHLPGRPSRGQRVVVGSRDVLHVLLSTRARHWNDIPSDQTFWCVCTLHPTNKPAKPGCLSSFVPVRPC